MNLNNQVWRPITFQGIMFPATLMGISILDPILTMADEDLRDWLWRLPICCGITKNAPAQTCARCARQATSLMVEHKQLVLDGIQARLAPHGFEPEGTYRDWITALERIANISKATSGDCFWSAPSHSSDPIQTAADVERFMAAFNLAIDKEGDRVDTRPPE